MKTPKAGKKPNVFRRASSTQHDVPTSSTTSRPAPDRSALLKLGHDVSRHPVPEIPVEKRAGATTRIRAQHPGIGKHFAAIDLGSSSAKMLIQRMGADGRMRTVVDVKIGASLGKGVQNGQPIPPENEKRALDALKEFLREAQRHGIDAKDIPLITTAVVRNASDGDAFLTRIHDELGLVQAKVLSGDDEANVGYRGAILMMNGAPGRYATLDLGGGSFQLAIGTEKGLAAGGSTQVGSNIILDTMLAPLAGPNGAGKVEHFDVVDSRLDEIATMPIDPVDLLGRTLVATGGVSKFLRAHFGRDVVTRQQIEALRRDVIVLPYDQRAALVQKGKDDTTMKALGIETLEGATEYGKKLPASSSLLLHMLDAIGLDEVRVSETDSRHFLIAGQV